MICTNFRDNLLPYVAVFCNNENLISDSKNDSYLVHPRTDCWHGVPPPGGGDPRWMGGAGCPADKEALARQTSQDEAEKESRT